MEYPARLSHLHLHGLERRHLTADLILTYRIIFGLVDVCMSGYFVLKSVYSDRVVTRSNPFKLSVNYCRSNTRKYFCSELVVKVWNSLPPSIVNFSSLATFRNSLTKINFRIYTTYQCFSFTGMCFICATCNFFILQKFNCHHFISLLYNVLSCFII